MVTSRTGIVGALDVGTTKVVCLIAQPDGDKFRVIGMSHQPAKGMKGGAVADMNLAEESIRAAIEQAERMAGEKLKDVYVSYSGGAIRSRILRVEVPVHGESVSEMDIHRLHLQCRGGVEQNAWHILNTIPVSYMVDGTSGVDDPRRMVAHTLAADMHVVAVPSGPLRNLCLCVERCMVTIQGVTVSAHAAALATLFEDQQRLGVIMVDIGGGATSIAVYRDERLQYVDSIPLGGTHITNDIARGLTTSVANAERLKTFYGSAIASPMDEREFIDVPRLGEDDRDESNHMAKSALVGIIAPRAEEILEMVRERLDALGPSVMAGQKVVLTGGASQLAGLDELAQRVLDKPVVMGKQHGIKGLGAEAVGPAFTAAAGLLRYVDIAHTITMTNPENDEPEVSSVIGRFGRWLKQNF